MKTQKDVGRNKNTTIAQSPSEKKARKLDPVKKVKSQNLKSNLYEDLSDFDDFDPIMRKFR